MSVVGFDFGNQNSYIAVARQGGIEVITNEYSLHATPSCVAFGANNRILGVAAKNQMTTNLKNTITNFKHLVGRTYSDEVTQDEKQWISPEMVKLPNDGIGLKVNFLGEPRVFTPEQIVSMLFHKLKSVTEHSVRATDPYAKVVDCVFSVPCYYTDSQRRTLLDCTRIAGLNCLRILNETTSVALAYGIYKQDLPADTEKPRTVVFVDCGHASTQAALVQFHKGKLQVKATSFDIGLGGRAFDTVLREYFREDIKKRYKIDAATNPRAWVRLLDECDKIKKQMSANTNPIPLNIECFMNDKDIASKCQRSEFEEMCAPLWDRFRGVLKRLLEEAKMKPSQIDVVESVGGSCRIPMLKAIIEEVLGREPSTTMNLDEAVARGCAMQCAILSPKFRVREFSVTDAQPFRIKLFWDPPVSGGEGGEQDVFEEHHQFPFSKMLTMYRKEPFTLSASYSLPNTVPSPKREIGDFTINNVTPNEQGEARKLKIKVRLNPNGVFSVSSASMIEKVVKTAEEMAAAAQPTTAENGPAPTPDTMDTGAQQNGDTERPVDGEASNASEKMEAGGENETGSGDSPAEKKDETAKTAKTKTVAIELPITEHVFALPADTAQRFVDMEIEMSRVDSLETQKRDAKNLLEEYVYDTRDKLCTVLGPFVLPADSEAFQSSLSAMEDWLYGDGDDVTKEVYVEKLNQLKAIGGPIIERYQENESRGAAFDALGSSLQTTRKIYESFTAGDELYKHLEPKDMEKVGKQLADKQQWMMEVMAKQAKRPLTEPPVVFTAEIYQQKEQLENFCRPIVTKAKPAPPPPPKVELPPDDAPAQDGPAPTDGSAPPPPAGDGSTMEID